MKKIFAVIALSVCMLSALHSQTISVTPSNPVYAMEFRADSVTATDTNWVSFYAPFNMYLAEVQAVAAIADSGSGGTGCGSFKLYKYGTSTAIAEDSILTAHTVASDAPSSSTTSKLTKGSIYKVKWTLPSGERLDDVTLIIWYRL